MAKLYFKYGAMGSSKTAQALITKFNYEERDMSVLLLKPAIDDRRRGYRPFQDRAFFPLYHGERGRRPLRAVSE